MLMKENRTTAVLVKDTNEQVAGNLYIERCRFKSYCCWIRPLKCSVVRVMTPQPDVAPIGLPVQDAHVKCLMVII